MSDHHARRYAAGEAMAKAAKAALAEILSDEFGTTKVMCLQIDHAPKLHAALKQYELTRDHP